MRFEEVLFIYIHIYIWGKGLADGDDKKNFTFHFSSLFFRGKGEAPPRYLAKYMPRLDRLQEEIGDRG